MWGRRIAAGCMLALSAGTGPAGAEGGGFFKNLFSGGGGSDASPSLTAPRAMDPADAYCPEVDIAGDGTVVRSFAGAAGDSAHLHHQLAFGQLSRECTARPDGSVSVKVGVRVRALLGPVGKPGRFEAPLTIAVKFDDSVLASRSRRVSVSVPADSAQGTTSVIEDELIVPPAKAVGYDIVVSLAGPAQAARTTTAKVKRPTGPSAPAQGAGQ